MVYRLSPYTSISAWLVKEYVYCPMIPWIITHYNIVEQPTTSMEDGANLDIDYKEETIKELGLPYDTIAYEKEILLPDNIFLKIDAILRKHNEYTIVEIKRYRRKRYSDQKAQVKTYAYLLTKHGKPVHNVVLVQDKKIVYKRRIEEIDLETIKKTIEQLQKLIDSDKPPKIKPTRKCWSCWYRKICPIH